MDKKWMVPADKDVQDICRRLNQKEEEEEEVQVNPERNPKS